MFKIFSIFNSFIIINIANKIYLTPLFFLVNINMGAACLRKSHSSPVDRSSIIIPRKVNTITVITKLNSLNEDLIHHTKTLEIPSRNRPIFNKLSQKILQQKMISGQSINPMQIF